MPKTTTHPNNALHKQAAVERKAKQGLVRAPESWLTKSAQRKLKAMARRTGVPCGEHIRVALDEYLSK